MKQRPLCFVIMPFQKKPDPAGGADIDFDRVYKNALEPAINDADMDPIRADEERTGGIIHKPMFERLLLCDYAVADLTAANANVFYELGVRHTARPRTTLTIFAKHQAILRKNWARLIQKIYEVDPLTCPKCQNKMKIISVIEDEEIIRKILQRRTSPQASWPLEH